MLRTRLSPFAISRFFLLALLFLLPWQTRWIFFDPFAFNGAWEYGRMSLYATEILLLLATVAAGVGFLNDHAALRERWQGLMKNYLVVPLPAIAAAWLGISALSIFFSVRPTFTAMATLKLFEAMVFALLLVVVGVPWRKAAWAIVGSGAVQALFAIWQFASQFVPANKWLGLAEHVPATLGDSVIVVNGERILRAYGSLPHPNILAAWLVAGVVCVVLLFLADRRWRWSWLYAVYSGLLVAGVFFSFSRASLVNFVFVFVVLVVAAWRDPVRRKKSLTALAWFGGLLVAMSVLLWPWLMPRLTASDRLEQQSFSERAAGIRQASALLQRYSLTGTGFGAYTAVLAKDRPNQPGWEYQPVHLTWLLLLVEWGMAGAIVLLAFFVEMIGRWILALRSRDGLAILMHSLPLLVISFGFFDHFLTSLWFGLCFFWVMIFFPALRRV